MKTITVLLTLCLMIASGPTSAGAADITAFFSTSNPDQTMKVDNTAWKQILARYISTTTDGVNLFAYAKVSATDRKQLKAYLADLQNTKVRDLSRDEQMAFWINLYNAQTIDVVLDHYPVRSIKDISLGGGFFSSGPWKKQVMAVEGQKLSLDNVEHDILRKVWRDPRVHYAVNCASLSCPNLAAKPFTAKELDSMLDEGARAYVNHPRGVGFRDGRLILSQIFSWYRSDFGRTDAEIVEHISKYASPDLQKKLKGTGRIDGYDYDWSLNEAK